MAYSFLRAGWLRTVSTGAVLCLSAAMLTGAEGLDTTDGVAQLGSRASTRDIETEDHGQYPGLTIVKSGISTSSIRKQAIAELPLGKLTPEAQKKTQAILKNLGMFRRLPTISFECDPQVYDYFLKNPDVAVATWRAMEISQFHLKETGPNQYHADAGDGSVGEVELMLHSNTDTLIHCDGAFKSPLLPKPIIARSLMRLQTTFSKEPDGRCLGTHSGDVFVEFPSQAIEAVAKVIAPVSHNIADRNFKQMTLYAHLMSQAMARHPGWIEHTSNQLDGISNQKKQDFLEVSARCCADARKRLAVAKGIQPFSPEEVLTPFRQWNAEGAGIGSTTPATRPATARPIQSASQPGSALLRN